MSPWPGTIAGVVILLSATAAVCFLLYFPDQKLGEDAAVAKYLFGMLILAAGAIIGFAIIRHAHIEHCNEILERMRVRVRAIYGSCSGGWYSSGHHHYYQPHYSHYQRRLLRYHYMVHRRYR